MPSAARASAHDANTAIMNIRNRGRSTDSATIAVIGRISASGCDGSARRVAQHRRELRVVGAAHGHVHVPEGKLSLRVVDGRLRGALQRGILHVADDTDDLVPAILHQGTAERPDDAGQRVDGLPDRILAGKIAPRQRVVHNHHPARRGGVARLEKPSAAERGANRFEITVRDRVVLGGRLVALRRRRRAAHQERDAPARHERQEVPYRRSLVSWAMEPDLCSR